MRARRIRSTAAALSFIALAVGGCHRGPSEGPPIELEPQALPILAEMAGADSSFRDLASVRVASDSLLAHLRQSGAADSLLRALDDAMRGRGPLAQDVAAASQSADSLLRALHQQPSRHDSLSGAQGAELERLQALLRRLRAGQP